MNRGVVVGALLAVLSVALFTALWFGLRSSNDGSGNKVSEFTAFATVEGYDEQGFDIKLYSRLNYNQNGQLLSWDLEAQVDYSSGGSNYRHVYKGGTTGVAYRGEVLSNGFYNITDCLIIDQQTILQEGNASFIPIEIGTDGRDLTFNPCSDCKTWRLEISGQTYQMWEKDGIVKFLSSRDNNFTITFFKEGSRQWFPDAIPASADEICFPNASNGSTPQALLDTVVQYVPFADSLLRPQMSHLKHHIHSMNDRIERKRKAGEVVTHWRDGANSVNRRLDKNYEHTFKRDKMAKHGVTTAGYCPSSWPGDGWCDPGCNDAAHNWDNGDCCPGTCTGYRRYPCGIASYQCLKSVVKECLFLHGVGNHGPNVFSSNKPNSDCNLGRCKYWGSMEYQLSGLCQKFTYADFDTNSRGWTDNYLQTQYADKALDVVANGGVVFAHSMGGMILGGACRYLGKCPKFYGLQNPYGGSAAADDTYLWVARKVLGDDAYGPAYDTLTRTRPGLMYNGGWLATTAKNQLSGALVGTDGWGGGGPSGVALLAVKTIVYGWKRCVETWWIFCTKWEDVWADGLVGYDEAAWTYYGYNGNYGGSSNNLYYRYGGNHNDGTGNSGNHNGYYDYMRMCASRGHP